jgi:hypothetical protein
MTANTPYDPPRASVPKQNYESEAASKLIKEIGVFGIGMGILASALAVSGITSLHSAPQIGGIDRGYVLCIPLILVGIMNVAAGIRVLMQRSETAVRFARIAGWCIAVYFVYMQLATGVLMLSLLALLVYCIPILKSVRCSKAVAALNGSVAG